MRIGGLASGMDIDSLVRDLMRAERMPLNKLTQKKQILEWQRDDYRGMNKLLKELDTLIFDGIDRQAQLQKLSATSTNESVVLAVAKPGATTSTTDITVNNLAKKASWVSDNKITNDLGEAVDSSKLLKDVTFKAADGTTYNFTDPIMLKLDVTQPDGTTKTGVEITIDPSTDSLSGAIKKLNSSGLDVSAFYDDAQQKMVISSNQTGSGSALKVSDPDPTVVDNQVTVDFFNALGFSKAAEGSEITVDDGTANDNAGKTLGQDASFTIDGFTTTRKTNTFTINDVTYTLKQAGSATVSVQQDTDSILDTIVSFVDKYNEVIEKINEKMTEERFRDYKPLSSQEKESMSEKEIELWEERAKSGHLRNDSILSGGLSQMRMDLYAKVGGINPTTGGDRPDQLAEIGITTSSNYGDRGKLIINEAKLRQAIQNDSEAVYEMFNGTSDATYETKGIARRLRDSIDNTMDSIELKAGNVLKTNQQFTLGRQLTSVDKQIESFEDRLIQVEDRYWRQFTAMEKMIQQANSQSTYLMQQFGGGMM
jgi:flagellar hook-associated protein 2